MLILPGTADIIRVTTGNAVATDVNVMYVDHTSAAYTPGRQLTAITTATTTTICSAPAASTQRSVKYMTICARGGAQTLVLQYFDGTNAFQLVGGATFALATGETLQYTDEDGFVVVASASTQQTGRLLRAPQYLTSGTSITHPIGTNTIIVEGVGGGGASGGTNAAAGSIGGSGGSGTWGRRTFTAGAATSTYVVGAGGTGAASAAGGNGTSSTFTHNGTTVTLPGGLGGAHLTGGTSDVGVAGGLTATAATNADISITGVGGGDGYRRGNVTTVPYGSHPAGSNPLGQGGKGKVLLNVVVVNESGTGYGSGAGARLGGTSAASVAGANGQPGLWIVWEYS